MTKEEIIKELEKLKTERLSDLRSINVKHTMLLEQIAELNYIIEKAKENDNAGLTE